MTKKRSGFTLIEVVIALSILVIVTGAAVVVIKQNIFSTSANKFKTQAVGLGQEGLNLVRGIRDTNLLENPSTTTPFAGIETSNCTSATPCYLEKNASTNKWELKQFRTPESAWEEGKEYITLNGKRFTREIIIE